MTEDIQSWEIFASLFRTGSVALSATEVGLDAPVVSKKISALEKKLGRKLFDRSTRPFVPKIVQKFGSLLVINKMRPGP